MERLEVALAVLVLILIIFSLLQVVRASHDFGQSGFEIITRARKHADLSSVDIAAFRGGKSRKHMNTIELFSSKSIPRYPAILATRRSLHTWAVSGGRRVRVIVADLRRRCRQVRLRGGRSSGG